MINMKDVKAYILKKRKKKRIKRITIITIVLVIGMVIFFTNAPIFNVKKITIQGVSYLSAENMSELIKDRIGKNIFTLNFKSIEKDLLSNKYVKSVKVKRIGLSTIKAYIVEEAPVYYVKIGDKFNIINENLDIVEETSNIEGRNLVEIKGIENNKNTRAVKQILENIYPYIAQNTQELRFDSFDVSEITNIRAYMGEVEIFFGDDSDLHNKMEYVYSTMLDEKLDFKKGYIYIENIDMPIIKKEQ